MELPLEDLPKDVLEMIKEGPQSRPMSERGVQCLNRKRKRRNGFKYLHKLSDESIEECEARIFC